LGKAGFNAKEQQQQRAFHVIKIRRQE